MVTRNYIYLLQYIKNETPVDVYNVLSSTVKHEICAWKKYLRVLWFTKKLPIHHPANLFTSTRPTLHVLEYLLPSHSRVGNLLVGQMVGSPLSRMLS